jgi:DNA-binding winged helix-turn-helix (wHTH) protein
VDRGAAQVYLGETTPVQLSTTPYRLVLCLYDAEGFRTNREIAKAVWGDEEWASDEMVRQTVRRVRKALKETGANADHYIVNQPGRGYRLQNTT